MSDLISRQAAIEAVSKALRTPIPCYGNDLLQDCMTLAKAIVKNIPSAEPERKKGKWIDGLPYINSHWWVCSVCHVSAPENHTGYNFCPSCGADMRGE